MAENSSAESTRRSLHGHWSSRFAFVLAVSGSAVGLGNIWKFPYVAGQNGGGAFVLVYLFCVFLVGLPIMMSEVLLGRRGRRNPVSTMALLGEEESGSAAWGLVGASGAVAGFLILSFYSVIAGWTMAYMFKAVSGIFANPTTESVGLVFANLTGSVAESGFWHTLFLGLTILLVALGVERGIERAVKFMMPALVILLLVLLGYAMSIGEFQRGFDFMFEPDFSKLSSQMILAAMGQAFFSLSIGTGAVMAYGAYLPQDASIIKTSFAVACTDTAIAILAGLVIFPIVFANGLDPTSGPGLVFQTLPLAFGQMPGGAFFASLFFLLLGFAALTSAVSLMEPAVAWLMESRDFRRPVAASLVGLVIWALGFLTVLSFNVLSDFTFLKGTFFDNLDFLTSNIMLPLGGLAITVFSAWVMCTASSANELDPEVGSGYDAWRFLARYVVPLAVILVFLNAIGVFA